LKTCESVLSVIADSRRVRGAEKISLDSLSFRKTIPSSSRLGKKLSICLIKRLGLPRESRRFIITYILREIRNANHVGLDFDEGRLASGRAIFSSEIGASGLRQSLPLAR
jgi:hypothetical protein